jgi:hypothetical protein
MLPEAILKEVLFKAGLNDLLQRSEAATGSGLDLNIDENGSNLSAGEK